MAHELSVSAHGGLEALKAFAEHRWAEAQKGAAENEKRRQAEHAERQALAGEFRARTKAMLADSPAAQGADRISVGQAGGAGEAGLRELEGQLRKLMLP